ncbi:type II secretion system protein [Burkholderiaceae bacterium UC74_6]
MKKRTGLPKRSSGFTLVELLVCMAILGLLASVALPMSEMTVQREKERELKRSLWEIRDALDAYRKAREDRAIIGDAGQSPYPPSLIELTKAVPDARVDHQGQILRFLRAVPRDPFADPDVPPEKSWGLRSYASEANNPQPGADVYDVHSMSRAVGLNGVPLSQW